MTYYQPQRHTELHVDASPIGVAAILVQKKDPKEAAGRVVAYASRALTEVEQRWSQIEREVLAISYGCEHFHLHIFGDKIDIYSDHKSLMPLLNNPHSNPACPFTEAHSTATAL